MSEDGKAEQPAKGADAAPNVRDANYKEKKGGRQNRQQRSNKPKWKDNNNAIAHVPKEKFTGRSEDLQGFIYDVSTSRGGVAYNRTTEEIARHDGEKYTSVGPYVRTAILTLNVPAPTRPTAPTDIHLEGLFCAPLRNYVPWGDEFFIKRPSIMCCFRENSVILYTVVCDPSVPPPGELCGYIQKFGVFLYILLHTIINYVLTYSIQAHLR
jgi:hypothetical protein